MAALFQEAQRVPEVPRATGNCIFLSPREEGVRLRVQRMSMESLVCCWLQLCFEPALNFLRPGSGLGKYSRGSLWYRQAELCPTAFALAFIAQYFLVYFFFCSPAWFPATSPMPGRHNTIFRTRWRGSSGRRQQAAPRLLTGGGRPWIHHHSSLLPAVLSTGALLPSQALHLGGQGG